MESVFSKLDCWTLVKHRWWLAVVLENRRRKIIVKKGSEFLNPDTIFKLISPTLQFCF